MLVGNEGVTVVRADLYVVVARASWDLRHDLARRRVEDGHADPVSLVDAIRTYPEVLAVALQAQACGRA